MKDDRRRRFDGKSDREDLPVRLVRGADHRHQGRQRYAQVLRRGDAEEVRRGRRLPRAAGTAMSLATDGHGAQGHRRTRPRSAAPGSGRPHATDLEPGARGAVQHAGTPRLARERRRRRSVRGQRCARHRGAVARCPVGRVRRGVAGSGARPAPQPGRERRRRAGRGAGRRPPSGRCACCRAAAGRSTE